MIRISSSSMCLPPNFASSWRIIAKVDVDHCYRVGQQGLLVHNMSQPNPSRPSNPNLKIVRATASEFQAEDCQDDEFFIAGKVQSGILTFTVQSLNHQGQRGPSNISGTDFFEAMSAQLGSAVQQIETDWSVGSGMTTNIDELNRLTSAPASGVSLEAAAARVWTGRRAASKGFTKVTVRRALPPNAQGSYQEVVVRFSKP